MTTGQIQYDRGARVTIFPPQDLGAPVVAPLVFNARPPVQGLAHRPQHHVQFNCQRSLSPEPNPFTLRLYNLGRSTRDTISGTVRRLASWLPPQDVVKIDGILRAGGQQITSTIGGMAAVRIDAGWGGAMQQLFVGTAEQIRTSWEGQDRVTEIRGTDGGFNFVAAQANKTFGPGTPAATVLQYLVETLGMTLAPTGALAALQGFTLVAGLSVQGDCARGISDLLDPAELTWWVEDGLVYVLGDGSLPGQPLVVSPQKIPGAIRLFRTPEVMEAGTLRLECALAADMRVGHDVVLAATEQRGTYRVESVQHQGSNRVGAFTTSAVVRSPSAALGI